MSPIPAEMVERVAKIKAEMSDLEFRYGKVFLEKTLHEVHFRYRDLKREMDAIHNEAVERALAATGSQG